MFKPFTKISLIFTIFIIIGIILITRLIQLQILDHHIYTKIAKQQHWGGFIIPAKRGKIIIQDYYSNEYINLATNTVQNTLFIDPFLAYKRKNIDELIEFITPIIFDEVQKQTIESLKKDENLKHILNSIKITEDEIIINKINPDILSGNNILTNLITKSKEEQIKEYKENLKKTIIDKANKNIKYHVLLRNVPDNILDKIKELLNNPTTKKAIEPIGIISEYKRYYPENEMLSQIIGFVNNDNIGQYGIEEQYDILLKGKDGMVIAEQDQRGRQLSLGNNEIIEPQHGADIYLTIDRAIQKKAEEIAKKYQIEMDADYVTIIVMEVETGKLLTVATYPYYNPNNYYEVYDLESINIDINKYKENLKQYHRNYPIIEKNNQFYKYKNNFGPSVFINHMISNLYEPGSIFKPLVMAAGIDAGEITPWTQCNICHGPYKVDEYTISTWNNKYYPNQTMHEVLERSDNVGMVFIQKKLGKSLMYKYIKNFGIGMHTDIEFETEKIGMLRNFRNWSNSEAATISFGQGLSVTPLQMITAINAIANNGILMRPYIVDKIIKDNQIYEKHYPKAIRRVITSKTAEIMKAMMVGVIQKEAGKLVRIDGYNIAGKTGTAQIAKGGKYEKGIGSTIASFVGFAPAENPRFTALIKVDRPRKTQWGSEAAAPIFREIAEFILQYYKIPKNK